MLLTNREPELREVWERLLDATAEVALCNNQVRILSDLVSLLACPVEDPHSESTNFDRAVFHWERLYMLSGKARDVMKRAYEMNEEWRVNRGA